MFRRLQHVECTNNIGFSNLQVGKLYCIVEIFPNHTLKLAGDDLTRYSASLFKPKLGPVRKEDFANPKERA